MSNERGRECLLQEQAATPDTTNCPKTLRFCTKPGMSAALTLTVCTRFSCGLLASVDQLTLLACSAKKAPMSISASLGQKFRNKSGDFMFLHLEAHRTKLYVSGDTTFSMPLTYDDVMRQTRTFIENASEDTLNDCWDDERTASLSQRNGLE